MEVWKDMRGEGNKVLNHRWRLENDAVDCEGTELGWSIGLIEKVVDVV